MKKSLFLLSLLLLGGGLLQAQLISGGVRLGLSTPGVDPESIIRQDANGQNEFVVSLKEAKYGYHGGLFLLVQGNRFFFQPEILFNSESAEYELQDFTQIGGVVNTAYSETYNYLDLPLIVGAKWGPLRLMAGPVGSIFLSSTSELENVAAYEEKFDNLTWGYQLGAGLKFGNLILDAKYEGALSDYGDHITLGGEAYSFDQRQNKFVFTLGLLF